MRKVIKIEMQPGEYYVFFFQNIITITGYGKMEYFTKGFDSKFRRSRYITEPTWNFDLDTDIYTYKKYNSFTEVLIDYPEILDL